MKLVIGTGACGFQRINQIFNRLGYTTTYKISPIKMQNSFEINYASFISRVLNNHSILIGHFYLNHIEDIIKSNTNARIICLKGDRQKTINSLKIHFGFRNPLIKAKGLYSRYNLDFFDEYVNYDNPIGSYYDDYYFKIEKLMSLYPQNILVVTSQQYFENYEVQKNVNQFLGLNGSIVEKKYFISDEVEITTSLHGGLGNNLFQMIEPLVFTKINNLPSPIFTTWDCSELPACNNSDVILGGHGGTIESFKNSFKNITFIDSKKANFDTKFMINDMFDFQILHKYREIILDCFEPSDNIKSYINEKYKGILIDSCSLHIRTWTSKGDVHDMPLDESYYTKSLKHINSKNILVFTDNISSCQRILNPLINEYRDKTFHLIDEDQFVSLFLISMCDNNIVNISTFSFWGAYLNKRQPNNITTIPHNFGHNPNMLCYNEWIKI